MRTLLASLVSAMLLLGCSSSDRLTEEALRKLDTRLLFLFDETRPAALGNIDVATQPDGTILVGVIIHCSDPDALRFLGDKVGTKTENLVTAKIGRTDLRQVLQMDGVKYVEAATMQSPQ